ncbi:MAG: TlyA family RNA methyltransferase [Anaerolineae bacterium]|nr:TlyA family RNA methyltransferase [Anaerolineae bacterium]
MEPKVRLDVLLVERGMAESRSQAQRLVMAGQVRVDGRVAVKPSVNVGAKADVTLESGPRYVSRGGEKLAAALQGFPVEVDGKVCADVGASTGGFTDCLLQDGASKVYAIDVGKGILHWKLRQDKRVVVMENTNARYVERLPEPVDLVTIDASFISLKVLLPVVKNWLGEMGQLVALIKPQFEAGRELAAKGKGVIRDAQVHRQVLGDVLTFAEKEGYRIKGLLLSSVIGPKGNLEFLAWLGLGDEENLDIEKLVADILPEEENSSET